MLSLQRTFKAVLKEKPLMLLSFLHLLVPLGNSLLSETTMKTGLIFFVSLVSMNHVSFFSYLLLVCSE